MHYFIEERIIAALPGYVDFESQVCYVTVYLVDTLHWADSARALFRHALPPDTSEVAREYCDGHVEVRVRAVPYSRDELWAFAKRIDTILAEPELRVRGSAWLRGDSLIVSAHSKAALERARKRLARDARIPWKMLVFRAPVPEEVDGPVSPPDAAYLAVLDTMAAAPPERRSPFVIDASSLPSSIKEADLARRGLRSRQPSDTCKVTADSLGVTVVSFFKPRQFVSGAYGFAVSWRANNYYYEVQCETGGCRVTDSGQLPGDKIPIGCVATVYGPDRRRNSPVPRRNE